MPRAKKEPFIPTPAAALTRTLDLIGGKWTVQIIHELLGGTRRFGELQTGLGGVSPKMLIARLKELERAGFVTRKWYPEIPPRVEYALTEQGRTLKPIIAAMEAWGETQAETSSPQPRRRTARTAS